MYSEEVAGFLNMINKPLMEIGEEIIPLFAVETIALNSVG